jgi:hypothetical protein
VTRRKLRVFIRLVMIDIANFVGVGPRRRGQYTSSDPMKPNSRCSDLPPQLVRKQPEDRKDVLAADIHPARGHNGHGGLHCGSGGSRRGRRTAEEQCSNVAFRREDCRVEITPLEIWNWLREKFCPVA